MGRKIKTVLIMGLTMVMLSGQCALVSYATGPATAGEPAEMEEPAGLGEPEESETSEEPAVTEELPEPGESEEPTEPEEPEEPTEPEEPAEPAEPEEPEEPEEPDLPVIRYELEVSKADGNNGYYLSAPKVTLRHVSAAGATNYLVRNGTQILASGTLSIQGETVTLGKGQFQEGENDLSVWMVDEAGEKVPDMACEKKLVMDTLAPELSLTVPGGADAWHQGSVTVLAEASDAGSQVAKISCMAGKDVIGTAEKSSASFCITQASAGGSGVRVTVTATDRAGNQSRMTRQVYIDGKAPRAQISGTEDYRIVSHPVELTYTVEEDNALAETKAWADWEDVSGHTSTLSVSSWQSTGTDASAWQKLEEDGIYQVHLTTADQAGYTDEKSLQVIVDTKKPEIRHVEDMEGKYLQHFRWQYTGDELVRDFTTYTYSVKLDGQLYQMGKEVTTEGRHSLEVTAKDAAGNQASSAASFVIDHTAPEILFGDVEDGGTYENECTFRIRLADTRDTIRQIRINGETQRLEADQDEYRFMVQEPGECTVSVKAFDLAGNQADRVLTFTVTPQAAASFTGRITQPVRGLFTGEAADDADGEDGTPSVTRAVPGVMIAAMIVLVLLILVGIAVAVLMYFRHKKTPEEEPA